MMRATFVTTVGCWRLRTAGCGASSAEPSSLRRC